MRILLRCTKYSRVRQATLLTYKAPLILRKVYIKVVASDNAQLQFYLLHLFKVAAASLVLLHLTCSNSHLLYLSLVICLVAVHAIHSGSCRHSGSWRHIGCWRLDGRDPRINNRSWRGSWGANGRLPTARSSRESSSLSHQVPLVNRTDLKT